MAEKPVSKLAGNQDGSRCLLSGSRKSPIPTAKLSLLSEIDVKEQDRISTSPGESGQVLGNGIVAGSLVSVGGDLGIGKSTLLLQICRSLAGAGQRALYISGEESLKQIKTRANHTGPVTGEPKFLCETNLEYVERVIGTENPQITVIDSIQTMYKEEISSVPGSVSQVRESTGILIQIVKSRETTIFMVRYVTKEGVVTGPRVLGHVVDTILYFEGDRNVSYRILRNAKNRFGFANEIGVFEMQEQGPAEVEGPSEYMLDGQSEEVSDVVASCSFEGTRSILLEVQALMTETNFGMPRRTAVGMDYNRVNLLMAMLEKRYHYEVSWLDVYVNITRDMKMNEPALDLAIIMALMPSYKDRPAGSKMLIFEEVGLSGEVRAVSQAGQRVNKVVRLGFTTCVLPEVCADKMRQVEGIRLIGVSNVREAIGTI